MPPSGKFIGSDGSRASLVGKVDMRRLMMTACVVGSLVLALDSHDGWLLFSAIRRLRYH